MMQKDQLQTQQEQLKSKLLRNSQKSTRSTLLEHDANESNKKRKAKDVKGTFKRLFRYSWKHKYIFILANIGLVVSSGGMTLLPLLCGNMIDDIKEGNSLTQDSLKFIVLTIIMALFSSLRGYTFMVLGEKIVLELRSQLFSKILEKDVEYFDKSKSGDLLSRLTSDISTVYAVASDNLSMLIRNFLQFFGSLVFLWVLSWKLTLIIIVITPIISFAILFIIKYTKKYQKQYSNKLAFANSLASQVFGNIRVVKSFSNEQIQSTNYDSLLDKVYTTGKRKHFLYGIMLFVMTLFGNLLILSILYFGGSQVIDQEMTIGDLTSYVLYTITLTIGFASISGIINQIISAMGVCEHLFEIMDEPIKIINGKKKFSFEDKEENNIIEFKDASFSYPSKQGVQIIKKMNLNIKYGQSVALVGSSGSGKSTIVNLILRFYDLTEGQLLVGGQDIKDTNLRTLRKQIGFVSQQPTLFSGSLRENIQYGLDQDEKSQAKVIKALEIANAKEFALNQSMFPQKLKTLVGQRGVKLSGGQKQRIAIARSVIKNPSLLIFDEATSALDAQSQSVVQKAIDMLLEARQKTMIIVAHRLSTIINCDRIIVMKNGEIVEEGSHKELLGLKGAYANLVEKQISSLV